MNDKNVMTVAEALAQVDHDGPTHGWFGPDHPIRVLAAEVRRLQAQLDSRYDKLGMCVSCHTTICRQHGMVSDERGDLHPECALEMRHKAEVERLKSEVETVHRYLDEQCQTPSPSLAAAATRLHDAYWDGKAEIERLTVQNQQADKTIVELGTTIKRLMDQMKRDHAETLQ